MKESPTLNDVQQMVDEWIRKHGVRYFSELTNTVVLMEEVGELARVIARKYGEQSFKPGEETISEEGEMADILFVLACLANQTGVNLSEAFLNKLKIKSERDKDRHRNNQKLKKG